MTPFERAQLMTAISQAIHLYQICVPWAGIVPSDEKILELLTACGLKTDLLQIKTCREFLQSAKKNETQ